MSFNFSSLDWYPKTLPTSTSLTTIATSVKVGAQSTLSSASQAIETATRTVDVRNLEKDIRGAQATLTVLLAENAVSTATNSAFKNHVDNLWFNATLNLEDLAKQTPYGAARLSLPANIVYVAVFFLLLLYFVLMVWKSRYHWFNVCFFCGYGLELAGFISRLCSEGDMNKMDPYICQLVVLTIAPVFVMAAIYYVLAEVIVIYGAKYSLLRPMWFTYIFIGCDVTSLVIQAVGGGTAATAEDNGLNSHPGTLVMVAGIAFQVFSMSVYLACLFTFFFGMYFLPATSLRKSSLTFLSDEDYKEFRKFLRITPENFLKLFFNTKSTHRYKNNYLEKFYKPQYSHIRARKLFPYFPFAILAATLCVYIRSIYRVVELAMGFSGFLMTHEVFLMVLDALMLALCGIIFIPFHPYFALGPQTISIAELRAAQREAREEKHAEAEKYFDSMEKKSSNSRDEHFYQTTNEQESNRERASLEG